MDYFYNQDWQMLEERVFDDQAQPVESHAYVWSPRYVDAPVGRWHDANNDGDCQDEGDTREKVTGTICAKQGTDRRLVAGRSGKWCLSPYFTRDANFNVTAAVEGTYDTGSQEWQWQLAERYVYDPYGEATAYDDEWANPAAPTADGPLYCGYFFDAETALYNVRWRIYHPTLSTWLTRDPLGYAAAGNRR